jgi:DHA1 family tetracycline resistance protein-like MFS transporter
MGRPGLRRMLVIDFVYWFAFAIFQTTFALFAARRFGFDAPQTGYFFAAFGVLGAVVQGAFIRPIVARLGDKPTFITGVICAAVGLVAAAFAHSVTMLAVSLVPLAFGIGFGHPTVSALVSRAGRGDEQGRVQGAAGAVESLGRALGPVWGNASLQRFGEATPYWSAAAFLVVTLVMSITYTVVDPVESRIADPLIR